MITSRTGYNNTSMKSSTKFYKKNEDYRELDPYKLFSNKICLIVKEVNKKSEVK